MMSSRHEVRVGLVAEVLRSAGVVRLRVRGKSMMPWIRPSDVLLVRRVEMRQVSPGDVVVLARAGQLVVHRVIRRCGTIGQPLLVTKGDAVRDADTPVFSSELLGRVTSMHRDGRRINLDTVRQAALGRLLARVSSSSRLWHLVARAARRLFIPRRKASSQPARILLSR